MLEQHIPYYRQLHRHENFNYSKIMYDTLGYQFLWTYFTLSPNTGKHYNLLHPVSFYGISKYNTVVPLITGLTQGYVLSQKPTSSSDLQWNFAPNHWASPHWTLVIDDGMSAVCYPNYVYTSEPFLLQVKVKKVVSTHVVTPHSSRQVTITYLNRHYPTYWFGRFGPQAWLVTSPDLTSLYHFLWKRHMKDITFQQT